MKRRWDQQPLKCYTGLMYHVRKNILNMTPSSSLNPKEKQFLILSLVLQESVKKRRWREGRRGEGKQEECGERTEGRVRWACGDSWLLCSDVVIIIWLTVELCWLCLLVNHEKKTTWIWSLTKTKKRGKNDPGRNRNYRWRREKTISSPSRSVSVRC